MTKKDFSIQQVRIHCRIQNPTGSKTPIIVINGGPGGNYQYLSNLAALATDRPVIFYDQAGTGVSGPLTDTSKWNLDYFTGELNLLIEALHNDSGYDAFVVLGQSWGTTIAASFAINYPSQRIKAFIWSGPCLNAARWAADQQLWMKQLEQKHQDAVAHALQTSQFDAPEYQEALNAFYAQHLCRLETWPEFLTESFGRMNTEMYNRMWGPSEFTVLGTLRDINLEPGLAGIKKPVLITCGEFDEAHPESCAVYQSHIAGSQLVVLHDASHSHHVEKEEQYLSEVNKFLQSNGL